MVFYQAGDMNATIFQQRKELYINERCFGLDHPNTAYSVALFCHGHNQSESAFRNIMSRAMLLLTSSYGPDHPVLAATYINVAVMYQDIGKMNAALRYLHVALKKNERFLGEEHIQTDTCCQ